MLLDGPYFSSILMLREQEPFWRRPCDNFVRAFDDPKCSFDWILFEVSSFSREFFSRHVACSWRRTWSPWRCRHCCYCPKHDWSAFNRKRARCLRIRSGLSHKNIKCQIFFIFVISKNFYQKSQKYQLMQNPKIYES